MKFSNRENERVELPDGRVIFISRSVAVAYQLHAILGDDRYVLLCKRGKEAIGGPSKWCLPCGYLDWDESGERAVIRELWEETGLVLTDVLFEEKSKVIKSYLHDPWKVVSDPHLDERQNVTLHYGTILQRSDDMLPMPSNKNAAPGEIDEVRWINIKDLESIDFAFNHDRRIKEFISFSTI